MQVVLKVVGGKNDGRQIKIAVPRFIIGRGETAHLRPASDLVSREHCEIVIGGGEVRIADLNSRNGTFVNGEQLAGTHLAQSGDSLRVGRLQFEVVVDMAQAGAKKPKVNDVVEAASRAASAKKKPSLEDSISDWLTDDDEDVGTTERQRIASSETLQLNLEETSVFGSGKEARDEQRRKEAEAREQEVAEKEGDGKTGGKKKPMKLPKQAKQMHEDSTTAADDVLRRFFKRR
jgi:pSer/pThr/pTyr-binding forkhead associated (FHA) protein